MDRPSVDIFEILSVELKFLQIHWEMLQYGQIPRPGYRISKMHLMIKKFNLLGIFTLDPVCQEDNQIFSFCKSIGHFSFHY